MGEIWGDDKLLGYHINALREQNKPKTFCVVLTSLPGDVLHGGHIDCLEEARQLGHCLVVAVDRDEYLINKKGYCVLPLEHRMKVIAALGCVDYVCPVKYSVPEVIRQISPDVFVKGGDRTLDTMDPNEIAVCKEKCIEILTGVGGYDKLGSSSKFFDKAFEQCWHYSIKKARMEAECIKMF